MFDFPATVAALDAVPEPYRVLYTEAAQGYALDAELTRRLDGPGPSLEQERTAALDAWAALGPSPEAVAALLVANEATQRDRDQHEAELSARHQAELEARDQRLAGLRGAFERQMVEAAATAEIAAQRGAAALLLPHVRGALAVVEDDAGVVIRVVDAAGAPRLDAAGNPLAVKDLVAELRQSEAFARAFDGTGKTGSGTPPNGSATTTPGSFRLSRDEARDPAAYRRARSEAAKAGQPLTIVE